MKQLYFVLFMTVTILRSTAQNQFVEDRRELASSFSKPAVGLTTLDSMPIVMSVVELSADGRYAAYIIGNQPLGSQTLVVRETEGKWKEEVLLKKGSITNFLFSLNGKYFYYKKGDSLLSLKTGTSITNYIASINALRTPKYVKGLWMAYEPKEGRGELMLYNMINGNIQRFNDVAGYQFHDGGKSVLIKTVHKQVNNIMLPSLQWVDLADGKINNIWIGRNSEMLETMQFDLEGNQIVFMVQDTITSEVRNEIWYYKKGMEKALLKVYNGTEGMPKGLKVSGNCDFSGNGEWIYFGIVKPSEIAILNSQLFKVDIWSYRDMDLYPAQIDRVEKPFTGVIGVTGDRVVCIDKAEDQLVSFINELPGDHVIVRNDSLAVPQNRKSDFWLVSFADGSRKLLKEPGRTIFGIGKPAFSPRGDWIVYWDYKKGSYYSYEIRTGKLHNLTSGLPSNFTDDYPSGTGIEPAAPVAGWCGDEENILIYDRFDLWKIDPSGRKPGINLTNGYGAKHRIKLRLVYEKNEIGRDLFFNGKEKVILTGFNDMDKSNGFFSKILGSSADPKLLTMGPYSYYRVNSQKPHDYFLLGDMQPVYAGEGSQEVWVVKRMSATEAPNYFFTKDLQHFTALTHLQPQLNYNWLTAELVSWRMLDGKTSQGILYKPENFDPNKKYPVIFNYYEQLSHRLHEFPFPGTAKGNINIPWFVSRGYLVFTPDIHYTVAASKGGRTVGESAYNSIVSAAKYLAKLSYVDGKHMAIQGHSFGGLETSYLVTHTNLFAAACEMAGSTDPISAYLTLTGENGKDISDKQDGIESFHEKYGATPWERPDLYIRNSAVLNAGKTCTPLLIVHNKKDGAIPWRQGEELYLALRRLGKPCWMLQYDSESHQLTGKSAIDYTLRLTAFFDHYLKGVPAPMWMTHHTLYKYNGVKNLQEPDSTGSCSINCKVCQEVKKKVN